MKLAALPRSTTNGKPRRYEPHEIKAAAAGRWVDFLVSLGIPIESLDGNHHPCPKCGGNDRFRLIDAKAGAVLCNQCFSGRNGDGLAAAQWFLGCSFPEATGRVAEYYGLDSTEVHGFVSGNRLKPIEILAAQKRCTVDGLTAFGGHSVGSDSVCFPTYGHDGEQCSTFTVRTHGSDIDRKGKNEKGKPAGLFFAHNDDGTVRMPMPGETWLLPEGVKDSSELLRISNGFCVSGLSTSHLPAKFARLFADVDVVIIPDRDSAGEKGAKKTARALHGVARSIRIVTLPVEYREDNGLDVRDVLAKDGGRELLLQAIADAREVGPDDLAADTSARKKRRDWRVEAQRAEGGEQTEFTPRPATDLGNAERFVSQHKDRVRYIATWESWHVWDETRWQPDITREVWRLAKKTVRSIYNEIAEIAKNPIADHDLFEELIRWAKASEKRERISAMLALGANEEGIAISHSVLDSDPWLLNCTNGTVDLRTGEMRGHSPADLITKTTGVEYVDEPGVDTPIFDEFLQSTFRGDQELIGFLQRLIGYSAAGVIQEHVLPIFYGNGSNGKSTFLNIVLDVLGDYGFQAPHGFMMMKRGETHPTELTDLFGARFVSVAETEDGQRLNEGLVKMLTGGERIRARRMRENYWEFTPSHTPFLATNYKPSIRGGDYGIWRRLKLIPFSATFIDSSEAERQPGAPLKDRELPSKLRAEQSGILKWIVEGCLEWQRVGLMAPKNVMVATENYKVENDSFKRWFEERCKIAPNDIWKASYAYKNYRNWCEENCERYISQVRFGEKIAEQGIAKERTKDGWYYEGVLPQD